MDPEGTAAQPERTSLLDSRKPLWRIVLFLALPVLAQQFLVLSVSISDRILAGRLDPLSRREHAEAIGQQTLALGLCGGGLAAGNWSAALAAEAPWEAGRAITARHVAYQAAQTTAIYMSWLVTSYTVLVSVGSTALVARFTGAGKARDAIEVTNQALLLAVAFGLLGTLVGLLGLEHFVQALQLRGEAAVFAADYLRPLLALLVFQVVESAGTACLVGAGDTRTGFWILGGVALLNLPLAWGLFLGWGPLPEMRFVGIALGTALSHTVGGLLVLVLLARGRSGLRLELGLLRPNLDLIRRLLRISIPAGVDSLALMGGHFWFLAIVNGLGDNASSAHGIALTWEALSFLFGNAFGTAAMALVGLNLGAGKPKRAAQCGWLALALGGGAMTLMGLVFYLLAPQMFGLFCPNPEQAPVIAAGVPVLRLEALAEPALACIIIFLYALRGAGDTRVPVFLNAIGIFGIRVPLAYLLTHDALDFELFEVWPGNSRLFGAWLAMVADLFIRGGFFLYRFSRGRWQTIHV
jgi:putative MATE family efflux protein